MTFGIATFLIQVATLMLDATVFISFIVLGLFVVGCGLCFASLFKLVHRFTTSRVTVKHEQEPSTSLYPPIKKTADLVSATVNREFKVTDESEEVAYRRKLERELHLRGGE